ncbi:hypothetical protein NV379_02520 [Paenibacillus sp. N1-5-1-14]|uniref:hypothetical protein n=1 Tax=Paenibacillus radicibacter TaxID=2972488 RepID=UPI0021593DBF|nr:hypothetical protein [Paenibacillus radicibacter]MCR8641521.1 hypothetical protein [Paenibacillus radicibacter]
MESKIKWIYVGSFVTENGILKAIVDVTNHATINNAARRKICKDKIGHYVIIKREKNYFHLPKLQVIYEKDGIQYLVDENNKFKSN